MDLRQIERAAKDQGWSVERTTKGHPRFVPPDPAGQACVFSGTPGDVRAIKNFVAQLRAQGFIWPWSAAQRRALRKAQREQDEESEDRD